MSTESKGIDDDEYAFCTRDRSNSDISDESPSIRSIAATRKALTFDKSALVGNSSGLKVGSNGLMKRFCTAQTSEYLPIITLSNLNNEDLTSAVAPKITSNKSTTFPFTRREFPTLAHQSSIEGTESLSSGLATSAALHPNQISFDNHVDESGDLPVPKKRPETHPIVEGNFYEIADREYDLSSPPSGDNIYSRFLRDEMLSWTWLLTSAKSIIFNQQVIKVFLAMLYFFGVMIFVSHLLVIVHLRIPSNATWGFNPQPLPDIILELIPRQNWGFEAAETLISFLSMCAFSVALLHQHTLVTMRRLFCIFASVFFIRAFSTVSTSLTQSSPHLQQMCPPVQIANAVDFTRRAFRILFGLGMRAKGGTTCGDYIYSGHTCSLILFNLFIVTYGPKKMFFLPLKAATSIACILGMSFILAAHEHYTVDVVLAIVISVLLFNEYHNVAHNQDLRQRDRVRIILSAPITYYMEHDGEGKLVNTFRIPFCHQFVLERWEQFRLYRQRRNNVDHQADAVFSV